MGLDFVVAAFGTARQALAQRANSSNEFGANQIAFGAASCLDPQNCRAKRQRTFTLRRFETTTSAFSSFRRTVMEMPLECIRQWRRRMVCQSSPDVVSGPGKDAVVS